MDLKEWQDRSLPKLREMDYGPASVEDVTILAYFFWNDERIETEFEAMECSFRCAFRALGVLPAVLVVNRTTPRMMDFCSKFRIDLQTDPTLNDGLRSLNMDCICNLHKRFQTKYVLVIQTDGILFRGGIEKFLQYDYVGAPWPKDKMTVSKLPYPKFGVGNGGLSLRSKRICRLASLVYRLLFWAFPYGWYFYEDLFYCYWVRMIAPVLFRRLSFPTVNVASEFSVEFPISECACSPLGFHSEIGFRTVMESTELLEVACVDHGFSKVGEVYAVVGGEHVTVGE